VDAGSPLGINRIASIVSIASSACRDVGLRWVMLTTVEIATMRRKSAEAASRRVFTRPATMLTYIGGPLDGWVERVSEADLTAWARGWCCVTSTGPVQDLYVIDRENRSARFHKYDGGPQGPVTQHSTYPLLLGSKRRREAASGVPPRWVKLGQPYYDSHIALVEQQLAVAAARLAATMNQVFADATTRSSPPVRDHH
jgi:hypothetical protein